MLERVYAVMWLAAIGALCISGAPPGRAEGADVQAPDLQGQIVTLKQALADANKRIFDLTTENERLVMENARLRGPQAAPSNPAAAKPAATPDAAHQRMDELEAQIATLRPRLKLAMDKVTALIRSTVDTPSEIPTGGFVRDGQVWRRDRINYGTFEHPHWAYNSVPIGPAVKVGDFRTNLDRTKAIQTAEAEAAPLKLEMAQLRASLDAATQDLKAAQAATPAKP